MVEGVFPAPPAKLALKPPPPPEPPATPAVKLFAPPPPPAVVIVLNTELLPLDPTLAPFPPAPPAPTVRVYDVTITDKPVPP